MIIVGWKKEGLSMKNWLDSLELLEPATYAGRLDPVASGLCIALSGKDRFNKETFLSQDKTYYLEVLLGIETDSGDILGVISNCQKSPLFLSPALVKASLQQLCGPVMQQPPPFSSIPIKGKPAFFYARQKDTKTVPPARLVNIKDIGLVGLKSLPKKDLWFNIERRVKQVNGDFRQTEIIEHWHNNLENLPDQLTVCTLWVTCTSGTYMRSLAEDLGVKLNTYGIAYRLVRTRVGDFRLPFDPKV